MQNKNSQIFHIIIVGLLILIAAFLVFGLTSQNSVVETSYLRSDDDLKDKNTISVTGSFSKEIKPDQVELSFTIKTEMKDSIQAQKENAKATTNVIGSLNNIGIDSNEIETLNYRIELVQKWNSEKQEYISGPIRVTNSIKVTTKNLDKVGEILDTVLRVKNPSSTITEASTQFSLTKEREREVNQELLEKSVENAKLKAEAIARPLGLSIVRLHSASETNVYIPHYSTSKSFRAEVESADIGTPINPSSITATANIKAVFEIS